MNASQRPDLNGFLHLNVSRLSDALVVRFQQPDMLTEEEVVRGIGGEFATLADRPDCQKVIVDFTDVEDLSSYMLGRLVMLRKNMAARQGQMCFAGSRPRFVSSSTKRCSASCLKLPIRPGESRPPWLAYSAELLRGRGLLLRSGRFLRMG